MKLEGYLFEGKFYKDLSELISKVFGEGNGPIELYSNESNKSLSQLNDAEFVAFLKENGAYDKYIERVHNDVPWDMRGKYISGSFTWKFAEVDYWSDLNIKWLKKLGV